MQARRRESRLKSLSRFSIVLLACLAGAQTTLAAGTSASTAINPSAYEIVKTKGDSITSADVTLGWSYIVSGAVTIAISIPAYYLSDDLFARSVYTLGQTLGVAAVGYGSYLVLIEGDYKRFQKVIDSSPDLTISQKNRMAMAFLEDNAARAKSVRKIRVITHGLTAALNFLSAATTDFSQLKSALYFVGGINTLAAINFSLSRSEEEKILDNMPSKKRRVQLDLMAMAYPVSNGAVTGLGLKISF
jgi:hypothetical protein